MPNNSKSNQKVKMKHLKNYLFAGLLVWLPIALTVWILKLLITWVDQLFPSKFFGLYFPGLGLIITLLVLIITGIIAKNILGQKVIRFWDKIISNIPIVKSIYKGIKQVSDTLLSSNGNAFRKALLVKFPHNDAWSIAFITGVPGKTILDIENADEYINVYVPTTPNPTSGYFIIVRKSDTKEINMSVDEALRYIISMGTVDPTK